MFNILFFRNTCFEIVIYALLVVLQVKLEQLISQKEKKPKKGYLLSVSDYCHRHH
jgi:hypothetical protein